MPTPLDTTDIDHAIELYLAGESLYEITSKTGVSRTALNRHRRARSIPARPTNNIDAEQVVRAYLAGASEYSLAQEHGVSRGPIKRILENAGVQRRGCSEAGLVRVSQMTAEQRRAQANAANKAARRRTSTEIELVRRALRIELSESTQSVGEQLMRQWLSDRGEAPTCQRAIGKYNVDLAMNPVAVEVLGGGWHSQKAAHAQRTPYILDQGWHLVMVWDHEGRSALTESAADYVVTFANHVRWNPPATCQYRVISGDGELLTARGREDDEFPVVPPPRGRVDVRA